MPEKLRLFRIKNGIGLLAARNFGAEAAIGEVVIFLDPMSEVNNGWIEPLLFHIQKVVIISVKISTKLLSFLEQYPTRRSSNRPSRHFDA